jgi:hypothetical protein
MNHVLKQFSMLAFALVFMTGVAFAQSTPNEQDITQKTNNNKATIQQDGGPGMKATIVQKGNDLNDATIRQNGENGLFVESAITQIGRKNRAITNAARRNGGNGVTKQTQKGNLNEAFINLNEGTSPSGDEGSNLEQYQEGNGNFADVSGGNRFTSFQKQVGSNNRAEASNFISNSSATQIQDGSNNIAVLSGTRFGSGADATQRQIGSNNVARFQLADVASNVTIQQRQVGNNIKSVINGVVDDVSGSTSFLTNQEGNNNLIEVEANQFGGGLNIQQLDRGNTARVHWNERSFTNITQNGIGNTANVNTP